MCPGEQLVNFAASMITIAAIISLGLRFPSRLLESSVMNSDMMNDMPLSISIYYDIRYGIALEYFKKHCERQ